MAAFPRYAIYFTPPRDDRVCRFGAAVLGYDAFTGQTQSFPVSLTDACRDWHDLTEDARKYGFHATLKAPFTLATGRDERDLINACGIFSSAPQAIATIAPVVRPIGDFIALVPETQPAALTTFAQACVEAFDDLRAPLTEADRARRNPEQLTPRQRANLDRWGYPYVLDDFRFHMTLTGRVPEARRAGIVDLLREQFAAERVETLTIDRIALFRQDAATSRFRIIAEHPLHSATA
jgi:putative phosphonate metabolism protein